MSVHDYVNVTKVNNPFTEKPCHALKWCPYGTLIEEYPLPLQSTKMSCRVFGHDCPAFYIRQNLSE